MKKLSEEHKIRSCPEYIQWRKDNFERDSYTCQECKQIGGELHIDHYPKPFAQILHENNIRSMEDAVNCDELWDIKNGRTLCVDCHKKTDNYLVNIKRHESNISA